MKTKKFSFDSPYVANKSGGPKGTAATTDMGRSPDHAPFQGTISCDQG